MNSLPTWMNLKDPPKEASQSVDYLIYDEYTDYQYGNITDLQASPQNQSTTVQTPLTSNSATSQVQTSALELVVTPSTVATLTAPRTTLPTKKNNSPIPPSPSSSGFTFFGVPLPSLNFNLWGNTGARKKSQRRDDNPNGRPGRSRYRVFPPTEPEIHRGGFVPLPQGQGGFVPIPDPRLVYERKTRNETSRHVNRTATITRVRHPPERRKNPRPPSTSPIPDGQRNHQPPLRDRSPVRDREELTTARNDPAALSSATSPRRVPSNSTRPEATVQVTEDEIEGPTTTTTTSSATLANDAENLEPEETILVDGRVANKVFWTTLSSAEVTGTRKEEDDDEASIEEVVVPTGVKKIGLWDVEERLPPGKRISAEDEELDYTTTEDIDLTPETPVSTEDSTVSEDETASRSTPATNQILEASALSALLIPGGQLRGSSPSRLPSGRSTITRIPAPHLGIGRAANESAKTIGDSAGKEGSVANVEEEDRSKMIEDTPGDASLEESVRSVEENPFNWYYKNYNDSDVEPYVAIVEETSGAAVAIKVDLRLTLVIIQGYLVILSGYQ